jgi:3-oxoacyl-[acyl-carrier-protein] synthase-1
MDDQEWMMNKGVIVKGMYVQTPLGKGLPLQVEAIRQGITAIEPYQAVLDPEKTIFASMLPSLAIEGWTRLEYYFKSALEELIEAYQIPKNEGTLVIISSTKGNIDLLQNPKWENQFPKERAFLPALCQQLQRHFGFENEVIGLSNACISGSLALALARYYLLSEQYQHVLVIGGDEVSRFIQSGFESFQAISDEPCKPFDAQRKGISLGEAIVGMYLCLSDFGKGIYLTGTGAANDANHISGPSRTGEGLYRSIQQALLEAGNPAVDYISAHGTATRYNDDMESIALQRADLQHIPVNSYKGVFGHTLGASGLLESALGIYCLEENCLLPSVGYQEPGTVAALEVITAYSTRTLQSFLKLASGFGGCNQALVFEKR